MRIMTPKQIKELRERLGLSRTEFAARLGLTESAIHYWEHGERKPSGTALTLMRMLEEGSLAKANGK